MLRESRCGRVEGRGERVSRRRQREFKRQGRRKRSRKSRVMVEREHSGRREAVGRRREMVAATRR